MSKLSDGSISICKFLEAYEQQPCLYNPELENYKNRVAREGRPYTAMIEELKRKIKSIRTVYSKELGTRRRFKEQGKPYDTKLIWFNLADAFLSHSHGRNRKKTPAVNPASRILFNATSDISMSEDAIEAAVGDETDYVSNTESTKQHFVASSTPSGRSTRHNSMTNGSGRRLTYDLTIDDSIVEENTQVPEEVTGQSQPNAQQQQQQRKPVYTSPGAAQPPVRSHQPESEQQQQQIDPPAIAPPPPLVAPAVPHPDDDMTHFGQSIGSQLRQITNPYSRSWAKMRIQQILFSAETGSFESSAGNFIDATNFTSPV
ncbi:GL16481 [Drosophila persimilis]|uniref:GL16481 n=1 Tax=Drosophila persimilis TaxID=7234 RepID=B4GWA9_DROPE|nr:GL16481 [Drosophila persimilis]